MPFYVRFLFLLSLSSYCTFAQDTVRTIVTDTSIIYVIKKAPVTIVEKVEVNIPPEKQKLFLALGGSILYYWQRTAAKSGHGEYLKQVNEHTSPLQPCYELYAEVFKYYQKVYLGVDLHFNRVRQRFTFPNESGENFSADNRFNYFGTGVYGGYTLAKTAHYRMVPCLGLQMNKLTSYSGYTVNKADHTQPQQLINEMKYNGHIFNIVAGVKNVIRVKQFIFDLQPCFTFTTSSYTDKTEVYNLYRSFAGLKVSFITQLF